MSIHFLFPYGTYVSANILCLGSRLASSSEIRSANKIDYEADIANGRCDGRTECHPESLSICEAVVEAMFDTEDSDSDDIN